MSTHDHTPEALAALLAAQKQAFTAAGAVDAATRRRRIQTAIDQYREAQKKSGLESESEQKKKDKQ